MRGEDKDDVEMSDDEADNDCCCAGDADTTDTDTEGGDASDNGYGMCSTEIPASAMSPAPDGGGSL